MKGIVIEKRKRKSVVMDEKGRFVKTKTAVTWADGKEVTYTSDGAKAVRGLSIAAAVVLVFALGIFAFAASNTYTVTLDVNPSIEIEVNAFNSVTSIQALNDDAEQIGDLSVLVGMRLGKAVNQAILMLLDEGYLQEDGTVVLSIDGKNKVRTVVREVSEAIEDAEVESEDDDPEDADEENGESKLKIYVGRITEEMAAAAEDLGVPVGKMVLAAKAQEEGADIDYEMASILSVQELQRIRNLSKTINKAAGLIEGTSSASQEESRGRLKQAEAITDKILREASKIEGNLEKLQAMIDEGEADQEMLDRHAILTEQLNDLLDRIEQLGITADLETETLIHEMAQAKGADSEEKARIREELKTAKKADNDAKHEEVRSRVEEKLAEVKAKVDMLKSAREMSGDIIDDEQEDEDTGNSGNPGKGIGKDKNENNGKGNGNN